MDILFIGFLSGIVTYCLLEIGRHSLKKYRENVDKKEKEWREAVREQSIKNIKKQYYLTPKGEQKNVD